MGKDNKFCVESVSVLLTSAAAAAGVLRLHFTINTTIVITTVQ